MATKKPSKGTTPKKAAAVKVVKKAARKPVVNPIVHFGPLSSPPLDATADFTDDIIRMFADAGAPINTKPRPEPNSLSLFELMSLAWERVKGKGDPDFPNVAPDYKGILEAHARAALKPDGALLKGDMELARFESACNQLRSYYKGE
jgi:hypothetical protein